MSASWHFIKKTSIGNLVRSRLGSATIISLEACTLKIFHTSNKDGALDIFIITVCDQLL